MQVVKASIDSVIYALDFSYWKKSSLRQCFPGKNVIFISNLSAVPKGALLAVWGMKTLVGVPVEGVRVVHLEDGFLRSVGLGADLIRPVSWVVDKQGIYYDATQPSDLECLLEKTVFPRDMNLRAALLRKRIVALGLTKYNVGYVNWQRPKNQKKVILVPGQVESDASLAYGAPSICTNMDLLKAVRLANPDAYIVYKPHPDVIAGLRAQGINEQSALTWCDEQVFDVDMGALLKMVDEVHVLTSLAGFEALLRGRLVICYGHPFYSGWGLTIDRVPNPRRVRRLSLEELVAGALIMYPLYLSRDTTTLISPEQALDELLQWRANETMVMPWWRPFFRLFLRVIVGVK